MQRTVTVLEVQEQELSIVYFVRYLILLQGPFNPTLHQELRECCFMNSQFLDIAHFILLALVHNLLVTVALRVRALRLHMIYDHPSHKALLLNVVEVVHLSLLEGEASILHILIALVYRLLFGVEIRCYCEGKGSD